jgi:hypothetical protein
VWFDCLESPQNRQLLSNEPLQAHSDLLRQALLLSESLTALTSTDWDLLIPQARRAALLARLETLLSERGLLDRVPKPVRTHLESARIVAENEDRVMRWEINRIQRALAGIDTPIVLLKGAAYTLAGLPLAKGRLSSDVDISAAAAPRPQDDC